MEKNDILNNLSEEETEQLSEQNKLLLLKIDILNVISDYCLEAMNIKVIKPSDYIRVDSAIKSLQYKLYKMIVYNEEEYKAIFNSNIVNISSENFLTIYNNAPDVKFTQEDTAVKSKIKVYEEFMDFLVNYLIKKGRKEFSNEDVDKFLSTLSQLNNYIETK